MQSKVVESVERSKTLAQELDELAARNPDADVSLERRQFEALLLHALKISGGDYAFIMSPAGKGAYAEQFVKLGAAAERDKQGCVQPCYDSLYNRRPDPMIRSVMRLRRGVEGKPADMGLPLCLPGSHPPIRYFLMVPIESGVSRTAVLFVANPERVQGTEAEADLMSELLSLGEVLSERQRQVHDETTQHFSDSGSDDSARHYVQLMSASINAVVIVDPSGLITAFNPAAESLFGRESAHALGTTFDRFVPQEFLMPILKRAESFDADPVPREVVAINHRSVSAVCESGNTIPLTTSAYYTRVGNTVYTTFVFDHEHDTQDLPDNRTSLQHFQALTNVAPVGIVQLGVDWTCDYANELWCQLSGLSINETLAEGWVDAIHAEDVVHTLVELRAALSENKVFSRNLRLQRPTGSISWVTLSATVTINELGQFTGCLLVLLDVTETYLAIERLRYADTHDVLTGLANRPEFLDKLQERLNSRPSRVKTALLYLDLDGFKAINDTLGHDCGDELLRKVAERLENAVSHGDICARLGGDEFTIILTSCSNSSDVCDTAEGIVRSFNETFDVYGNDLHLSTSIGIALADELTSSSDDFIKQADTALYKAKSSGRSRWVVYTQEFQHEDIQRSALEARVRRATERQEFTLVFQPQFLIDDESIVSFEALLRWAPSDIPIPDTQLLVNVLEDNGLINDVGQWVLETACMQFRQWEELGLLHEECTMSVNVSPAQLSLANFVSRVDCILDRCGMAAHQLNLEITESALIEKNSSCIRVINQLKEMGVQLSLDDFGTGYASLSYLTRLPIDFLKIDKSFVMAMDTDDSSRTIVMSVLAMAGTLNIDVVAEGIEDRGTLAQLRQAKCKYGQGYLVSKPRTARELEPMLIRNQCHTGDVVELA